MQGDGSLKVFDAEHDRRAFDDGKVGDFFEGIGDCAVGSVVEHQDEGDAFAFVPFGLDDGRDADFCCAENIGDFGERAGDVDDIETNEVTRIDVRDGQDCAVAFVRDERGKAMFGAEFQVECGIGDVAKNGAGGGVFASPTAVKEGITDNVATDENGIEDVVNASEDVGVWDEGGIDGDLNPALGFAICT